MCFAPVISAWHPGFDIIFHYLTPAKIAAAYVHNAVRQFKCLHKAFGIAKYLRMERPACIFVIFANDHLFNLIKLVNSIQAVSIFASSACFTTETRLHRNEFYRQFALFQKFARMIGSERNFSCSGQIKLIPFHAISLLFTAWKIGSTSHRLITHQ